MNEIDFSKYLIPKDQESQPSDSSIDFSKYLLPKETQKKESSAFGEVLPQAAKGYVSGKLGIVGDVLDLLRAQPKEILPGETVQRSMEHDILTKMQQPGYVPSIGELDILSEQEPSIPRFSRFPSTEGVKQTIEDVGGPGEAETFLGKWAGRAGELFGGGVRGGLAKSPELAVKTGKLMASGAKLGAKILPAAAASLVGETAKELNFSPKTQGVAEFLTVLASSVSLKNGFIGAVKFKDSLYEKAKSLIPEGAVTNAQPMKKSLIELRKELTKGTLAPSEKFVVDEIDKILPKIKEGKIAVDEAWASKRSLNEKLQGLYTNQEVAAKGRAKHLAKTIGSDLENVIKEYGKENPEFYKAFSGAQEAHGAIMESTVISRNLKKALGKIGTHNAGSFGAHALFFEPSTVAKGLGKLASASLVGIPILKTGEFLTRVIKSPTLAKYYFGTLKEAAKENIPGVIKNFQKLDQEMQSDVRLKNWVKNHSQIE